MQISRNCSQGFGARRRWWYRFPSSRHHNGQLKYTQAFPKTHAQPLPRFYHQAENFKGLRVSIKKPYPYAAGASTSRIALGSGWLELGGLGFIVRLGVGLGCLTARILHPELFLTWQLGQTPSTKRHGQ